MRILINTLPLVTPLTGVGKYALNVARGLKKLAATGARGAPDAPNYTYYYGYYSPRLLDINAPDALKTPLDRGLERIGRAKEAVKKVPVLRDIAREGKSVVNALSIKRRSFDLYFEPNYIPLSFRSRKTVVTIHDFSFIDHPEWLPPDRARYFSRHFHKKIGRADRIIVVSDFIRNEAIRLLDIEPERIETVYHGFDRSIFKPLAGKSVAAARARYNLPGRFILSVGSMEPRKNVETLVRAYMSLDASVRREVKLVLAGFEGWRNKAIFKEIARAGDDVRYLGYVTELELAGLYGLSELFVFPSLYEGFGLPVIEAMASGAPVVASSTSSLPEVCARAARLIDPYDVNDLKNGMLDVLTDEKLRTGLREKGLERARFFSWEKSAKEHFRIFSDVLKA
jgi:glycosyltransferase involved in cell wall biosynthesis